MASMVFLMQMLRTTCFDRFLQVRRNDMPVSTCTRLVALFAGKFFQFSASRRPGRAQGVRKSVRDLTSVALLKLICISALSGGILIFMHPSAAQAARCYAWVDGEYQYGGISGNRRYYSSQEVKDNCVSESSAQPSDFIGAMQDNSSTMRADHRIYGTTSTDGYRVNKALTEFNGYYYPTGSSMSYTIDRHSGGVYFSGTFYYFESYCTNQSTGYPCG